jgi:hypothetical protein
MCQRGGLVKVLQSPGCSQSVLLVVVLECFRKGMMTFLICQLKKP